MSRATRTVVITGGNAGLGYECASAIAAASPDWRVLIASRNEQRAADAVARLQGATGNRAIEAMQLDLASLDSVRGFARALAARDIAPIHALVCNAGIQVVSKLTFTDDGFETNFAVNHLGHFLLVNLVLAQLASPARIVFVSSDTHDPKRRTGMPDPRYRDAEALAKPPAEPSEKANSLRAGQCRYTTSKLCNVLCTYELARRLEQSDPGHSPGRTTVNAFNPGLMPGSGLARDFSPMMRFGWKYMMPALRLLPHVHSTKASGHALARLVLDSELETVTGKYFDGTKQVASSDDSYDEAKALDLWTTSESLVAPTGATRQRPIPEAKVPAGPGRVD